MTRNSHDKDQVRGAPKIEIGPPPRAFGPSYAYWRGIVARAERIIIDNGPIMIYVAATSGLRNRVSRHDGLKAQLAAAVFRHQQAFRSFQGLTTTLVDRDGVNVTVDVDYVETEKRIERYFASTKTHTSTFEYLPVPVLAFVIDQLENLSN